MECEKFHFLGVRFHSLAMDFSADAAISHRHKLMVTLLMGATPSFVRREDATVSELLARQYRMRLQPL
jgi:hypothetical protein